MNHDRNISIPLIAAALLLVIATAAQADRITLVRTASVQADAVLLSDIARLDGDNALALAEVTIARFDGDQQQIKLTRLDVRDVLDSYAVHWGLLSLSGQQQITVNRAAAPPAQTIAQTPAEPAIEAHAVQANPLTALTTAAAGRTLRELAQEYLVSRAGLSASQMRITWDHDRSPVWQRTDADNRFEIEPRNRDIAGRIPMTVRQYRGDELVDTLRLGADVEIHSRVVIAARPVSRGQTIVGDDVKNESRWLDTGRKLPLTDALALVGQVAARQIQVGQMLVEGDTKPSLMVKRGQLVTLRAISGGFSIKTVGRAMSDGHQDEFIEVRHPRTRQVYHVRVCGPQQAVMVIGTESQEQPGGGA